MHKFLMILLMNVAVGAQMLTTDTTDRTTSPAVVNMDTLRQSTAVSVKMYGALGNGSTDDTVAIQAAINSAEVGLNTIYFPCGTYITSAQLTWTVKPLTISPAGGMVGENATCVTIKYTGSSTITAVLEVTTGVPFVYFYDFTIHYIFIEGNAHVSHVLHLVRPSHISFDKVRMWGANPTSGDCLNIFSGVGGTLNIPSCDFFSSTIGSAANPFNGIVLDGASGSDQTTTMSIISPIIELNNQASGGIGLWLKDATQVFISGCQNALNHQGLSVMGTNNTITNCLFENNTVASYIGGNNNKVSGAIFSAFSPVSVRGGSVQIDGRQNKLENSQVQNVVTVLSTASLAAVDDDLHGSFPVDMGIGTRMHNITFTNPGLNSQFPHSCESTPNSLGTNSAAVQNCSGQWIIGGAASLLSPTVFPTGKAWRAIFTGTFGINSTCAGCAAEPRVIEINETNNTITAPDAATLTFAVNGSGNFVVSGGTGIDTFQGSFDFIPDVSSTTSGVNSMKLSGGLSLGGKATATAFGIGSNTAPMVGTPTVGQAACIKAAGPPVVIGYCSTVVSAGGGCTCN